MRIQNKGIRYLQNIMKREFRYKEMNPYAGSTIRLSEEEKEEQNKKPVWERKFDWAKYMKHKGPLKLGTGLSGLAVEPYPRMKLMKLLYLLLEEVKELPDQYGIY